MKTNKCKNRRNELVFAILCALNSYNISHWTCKSIYIDIHIFISCNYVTKTLMTYIADNYDKLYTEISSLYALKLHEVRLIK